MFRAIPLLAVSLVATLGQLSSAQQRDALVLLVGTDTFSIERFARSKDRLDSEIFVKGQGARVNFTATVTQDGSVSRLESQFRMAAADRDSPPAQRAIISFVGDSVIAEVSTGTQSATQRIKTTAGAVPYINPSFSLIEVLLLRARTIGGDSVQVPSFQVQGGQTVPFTVVRRGADSVIISVAGLPARLAVDANGDIVGGAVPSQGLRILRVRNAPESGMTVAKPDYSAPPDAPYIAEEVAVPTRAGFTLAGTLTLPKRGRGPLPALVMITGSGPEDRDEAIPGVSGYRPFRQIADTLGRNGIAVLRLDDRGFGASGGDASQATSGDFADDIRAALDYLRSRGDIDAKRLGLIGHSEGGVIAPMVAADDSTLRGVVIMAGPSWSGRRIIEYQNRYVLEKSPNMTVSQRDSLLRASMRIVDSSAATKLWMRFFLDYDPLPTAKKVRVPVLILQGETDRQVTATQAEELGSAIRAGGNRDVTVKVFAHANHLFIEDRDGNPRTYGGLPVHAIRSDVLGTLTAWVEKRFR
jgi:hypothetical protein